MGHEVLDCGPEVRLLLEAGRDEVVRRGREMLGDGRHGRPCCYAEHQGKVIAERLIVPRMRARRHLDDAAAETPDVRSSAVCFAAYDLAMRITRSMSQHCGFLPPEQEMRAFRRTI